MSYSDLTPTVRLPKTSSRIPYRFIGLLFGILPWVIFPLMTLGAAFQVFGDITIGRLFSFSFFVGPLLTILFGRLAQKKGQAYASGIIALGSVNLLNALFLILVQYLFISQTSIHGCDFSCVLSLYW